GSPGAAERVHAAGHRRRLAGCINTTEGSGLWLRNYFGTAGFRENQQGAARGVRSGAGDQAGSDGVSVDSRVLAIWCMDWPAVAAAAAAGLPATSPIAV